MKNVIKIIRASDNCDIYCEFVRTSYKDLTIVWKFSTREETHKEIPGLIQFGVPIKIAMIYDDYTIYIKTKSSELFIKPDLIHIVKRKERNEA
jgi:hypothetical protein